jgi:ATP-dependent DNA ligase
MPSDSESTYETQIVYKKTSTGKIQQWRAWVEKTPTGYLLKVESGQTGGKLKETAGQVIDVGKQKRTAKEQAIFEAKSKLKKKRDEAYYDTVEEAQTQVKLLPMLAHPFTKRKHNITYPAIVQRKFDGVRCLAVLNSDKTVTLMSRKGKEFPHLEHIKNDVLAQNKNQSLVLDGELYSDTLTFQELVGLVKRVTLKPGNDKQMLEISLRVYDCVNTRKTDNFQDRYLDIMGITHGAKYLSLVENITVDNEAQIHEAQRKFVEEGYEGAMVRNLLGTYAIGKRSADLQKVKTFLDGEYLIVGFTQGTGGETGCIIWECHTPAGQPFRVRPRGTQEDRKVLFQNGSDYIGKKLTVRYQELTDDGVPRFPVGITIRDYE